MTKEETLRIIIFIERSISRLLRRFWLLAKIFRQGVESLSGRYLVSDVLIEHIREEDNAKGESSRCRHDQVRQMPGP